MNFVSQTPSEVRQNVFSDESFAFLTGLLEARAPSGFEDQTQQVFMDYCRSFADDVGQDQYGNAWASVGPKDAPAVLMVGHGDEIGLIVNRVEDNGFLRMFAVGGVDPAVLVARRVVLQAADGSQIPGVVGALPIHLQDRNAEAKSPKLWDLFLDVGASSAKEVAEMGVGVGTVGTLIESWGLLSPHRIVSRALDNKIGVFSAAEALRNIDRTALDVRVVAVSTVQEEIGAIGAQMVASSLAPKAAFVIDVTHATDIPGCNQNRFGAIGLGKGPTITHGAANHRGLLAHTLATAESHNIDLQHEAANRYTGTDTDNIYRQLGGIPSVLVSLPNRYMHTTAEQSDLRDLQSIVTLLAHAVPSALKQ